MGTFDMPALSHAAEYAAMFTRTTGDRVRLADTDFDY
jgi:urease alpha subunit